MVFVLPAEMNDIWPGNCNHYRVIDDTTMGHAPAGDFEESVNVVHYCHNFRERLTVAADVGLVWAEWRYDYRWMRMVWSEYYLWRLKALQVPQ